MKKTILIALMALIGLSAFAQSAQQVLDRTAKVIGNKSGASANFTISNAKIGSSSGTIAIKGNKFKCPYATSYRMVQRKDSMDISEEDQRGKHLYPNPGPTDGNEPLYLY